MLFAPELPLSVVEVWLIELESTRWMELLVARLILAANKRPALSFAQATLCLR